MRQIYYAKRQHKSRKKLPIIILPLGLLLVTTYLLVRIFTANFASESILGKEIDSYPTLSPTSTPQENTIASSEQLGQVIQDALTGTHGSYGIVVKNLKTGENYSLNEHVSYDTASLYKLWVMAETNRQIKMGTLNENEILSEKYETLNSKFNIDPKTAEFNEGEISLSVKDALDKMIVISDNYAALLLSLRLQLANVASFLTMNGFNESAIGANGKGPTTTAYDIALFFEKLYKNQIIDMEYSNKMLELLKRQRLNNKIPKYLPEDVFVAHKTGELDEYTHDGGIVYAQDDDYIIVVLSKSDDPDLAENRISNVSEAVFNYFTKKQ